MDVSTSAMPSPLSPLATSEHCRKLEHPNALTTALACFILAGILISSLPPHYKIAARRTSEGLSPWWVLLGGLSSISAIGCILVLPASRKDVACCNEIGAGACVSALLGIFQMGVQWACFMFIVMLFLIFFPAHPASDLANSTPSLTAASDASPPRRRDALIVGVTTLVSLLVVGVVSIAVVAAYPKHTQGWANVLGIMAGILSGVQYLPQIYYTWRLGDVKSLSIVTMMIQVPGAFLFAFSLWLRVGWEGWGTWLVYLITGLLQGILFVIALTYQFRGRGKGGFESYSSDDDDNPDGMDGARDSRSDTPALEEGGDGVGDTATERTGLLGNGNGYGTSKSQPRSMEGRGTVRQDTQRSASSRQLGMLYAATPPEHDSDTSEDTQKPLVGSRRKKK